MLRITQPEKYEKRLLFRLGATTPGKHYPTLRFGEAGDTKRKPKTVGRLLFRKHRYPRLAMFCDVAFWNTSANIEIGEGLGETRPTYCNTCKVLLN